MPTVPWPGQIQVAVPRPRDCVEARSEEETRKHALEEPGFPRVGGLAERVEDGNSLGGKERRTLALPTACAVSWGHHEW